MDRFSLFLSGFCLLGQSVLHIVFVSRLTGKRRSARDILLYLLLLCMTERLSIALAIPQELSIAAEVSLLCGVSRFAMGARWSTSWTAALLAVYVSQLSFGIINSAEAAIFPDLIGRALLYPLLFLATLAAFGICAGCYAAVLKCLSFREDGYAPDIGLLVSPCLFFFAAELYILRTAYSALPPAPSPEEAVRHGALLSLQILGLIALLCTSCAYQRVRRSFQTQGALQSLSQAVQAQKTYLAEAQMREKQTRSFRHDIKDHLTVLDGLLRSGELDEGRAYLQKLEAASAALSFQYQTGDPVVDIILREKLGLAQADGIETEVSLLLPKPCGIDGFDLCVIFANALDNAIHACRAVEGTRSIRIVGERQGDFYLLTFDNTCLDGPLPPMGTGLSNIRSAAEKYRGAMLTEKADGRFSLHVLLNIS